VERANFLDHNLRTDVSCSETLLGLIGELSSDRQVLLGKFLHWDIQAFTVENLIMQDCP